MKFAVAGAPTQTGQDNLLDEVDEIFLSTQLELAWPAAVIASKMMDSSKLIRGNAELAVYLLKSLQLLDDAFDVMDELSGYGIIFREFNPQRMKVILEIAVDLIHANW
jgi:hypothetical protein